jgi:cytochrome bd-type quinol oxidase subunit 2
MIMNTQDSISETFKRPSAFFPVAMSLAAFMVVAIHVAMFGDARERDESAAAHIWQLLMVAQIPIVLFFASKWLRRTPREARVVLALQIAAAFVALAPVYFLGL